MKPVAALLLCLAACAANEGTSSSSLTQEPGACGELETHVIGIHSGATPPGAAGAMAEVAVKRTGKMALVLSAHDATTWHVTAVPGAEIEVIYATGIGKQKVIAPAGVRVVEQSKADGPTYACGYTFPQHGTDCDTTSLLKLVEKRVHPWTSFHGCYTAGSWSIEENMAVVGDCNADAGAAQADVVQGCDGGDSCGGPILL